MKNQDDLSNKNNSIKPDNTDDQLSKLFNREDNFFEDRYSQNDSDNFIMTLTLSAIAISIVIIGLVFLIPDQKTQKHKTAEKKQEKIIKKKTAIHKVSQKTEKKVKAKDTKKNMVLAKKRNVFNLFSKRENILLLGVDSNGKGTDPFRNTRSDTIIIVNLDWFSKTINLVSIPRDSKVFISDNHGIGKINSAHALGGPELTIKTIKDMFGVQIDHYVSVNYSGIKKLVDAIGGVPVNVEKRMYYTDKTAGLYINLERGHQLLDSKKAEQYLRFRHDAKGDIGRMERQRWFLKSLVDKLQSPTIIPKIPELIQIASKYVRTDMNVFQLSKYAGLAKSINLSQVQMSTLPGHPSQSTFASYWILEAEKVQEIIDRLIYRDNVANTKDKLKVSLVYYDETKNKIDEIKEILGEKNFEISCTKKANYAHSEIIGHSKYISLNMANKIRKIVPELKNAQFSLVNDRYHCRKCDITLVIAND